MELFEQIRCEYERGVGTVKGVVHRRLFHEALGSAVSVIGNEPRLGPAVAFI